ncbi:hypothetical protein [Methylobacterium sp.]|uniref:hypothetical protein n=1 Tax=Methylobacterium sp. TaxID=409 RepID=UPI003B01AB9E
MDYTHKKQTGGSGQFARVKIVVEPNEPGKGFEFASRRSSAVRCPRNTFRASKRVSTRCWDIRHPDRLPGRRHEGRL